MWVVLLFCKLSGSTTRNRTYLVQACLRLPFLFLFLNHFTNNAPFDIQHFPASNLSKIHHWWNLLCNNETRSHLWPWHVAICQWKKESGVVPPSTRNWDMYNSQCCCYMCMVLVLFAATTTAASSTREIPLRVTTHLPQIHPPQRYDCLSITAVPKKCLVPKFMLGLATIVGCPLLLLLLLFSWGAVVEYTLDRAVEATIFLYDLF